MGRAFIFIFCSLAATSAGADDVNKYTQFLRDLAENPRARKLTFRSIKNEGDAEYHTVLEVGRDESVIRYFQKSIYEVRGFPGMIRTELTWQHYSPGVRFTVKEISDKEGFPPRISYNATLNNILGDIWDFRYAPVSELLAFDSGLGMFWHEILSDAQAVCNVTESGEGVLVSAENPTNWRFEFVFSKGQALKLLEVRFQNLAAPKSDGMFVEEYELLGIQTESIDDRPMITAIDESVVSAKQYSNGSGVDTSARWTKELLSHGKITTPLNSRIEFEDREIADGTTVRVLSDKGIPYEFTNGFVVKVVDSERMIEGEDARFRKPPGHRWWWYALWVGAVLALMTAFALVLFKRRA